MPSRSGRCWYCGDEALQTDDPPEHVVPSAIGGELTTDRVCRACNTRAGKEIDKPFLSDWVIAWERLIWDIRDVRHGKDKPPPLPREKLALDDDTEVRMNRDYTVEVIPTVDRDSTPMRIVAGSRDELNDIVRKVTERAERGGRQLTTGEIAEAVIGKVFGHVEFDGQLWLRATTKIAVAAASLVIDESWVLSKQAQKYREFLWHASPRTFDGSAPATAFPQPVDPRLAAVVNPPIHLLLFLPQPGRALFRSHLFGNVSAGTVEFDVTGAPPRNTWELDPGTRTVREKTLDDLLTDAAIRLTSP